MHLSETDKRVNNQNAVTNISQMSYRPVTDIKSTTCKQRTTVSLILWKYWNYRRAFVYISASPWEKFYKKENTQQTFTCSNLQTTTKKKDTRKKCKVCSKSTMKTTEQRRSGVFIVDFEHILHLFLVSILWTLSK